MEELKEKPQKKDIIINHIITVLGVLGIIATIVLFYIGFSKGLLTDETKMANFLRSTEPFTPIVFFFHPDFSNCRACYARCDYHSSRSTDFRRVLGLYIELCVYCNRLDYCVLVVPNLRKACALGACR